jgi:hypothetical protein
MALYESVVPECHHIRVCSRGSRVVSVEFDKKKDYYWPACANAAIARVAAKIIQTYPAPDLTLVNKVEDSILKSFPSHLSAEQLEASIEFGTMVADLVFEWSMKDGTFNPDGTVTSCPPLCAFRPSRQLATHTAWFPACSGCLSG